MAITVYTFPNADSIMIRLTTANVDINKDQKKRLTEFAKHWERNERVTALDIARYWSKNCSRHFLPEDAARILRRLFMNNSYFAEMVISSIHPEQSSSDDPVIEPTVIAIEESETALQIGVDYATTEDVTAIQVVALESDGKPSVVAETTEVYGVDFDTMTMKELKGYALANNIDISRLSKKAEIAAYLKEFYAG